MGSRYALEEIQCQSLDSEALLAASNSLQRRILAAIAVSDDIKVRVAELDFRLANLSQSLESIQSGG
jgi:hypothetical protein